MLSSFQKNKELNLAIAKFYKKYKKEILTSYYLVLL